MKLTIVAIAVSLLLTSCGGAPVPAPSCEPSEWGPCCTIGERRCTDDTNMAVLCETETAGPGTVSWIPLIECPAPRAYAGEDLCPCNRRGNIRGFHPDPGEECAAVESCAGTTCRSFCAWVPSR